MGLAMASNFLVRQKAGLFIAPAGFWPRDQNLRRHHWSPCI